MTSLILTALMILSPGWPAQDGPFAKADKLFASRDNLESLKQAVSMMEEAIARDKNNYEASWRMAKYLYYLADVETDEPKKSRLIHRAIDAAKKAVALDGARVEGHFWLAAASGELADMKGGIGSVGLVKIIRKEFEAALAIEPSYENGASYLALGQIDLSMPRLLGGSERRGMARLEEGLRAYPSNAELKLATAEAYEKKGRKDEARKLLESILATPDPARSPNEIEDIRNKARRLLERLK
ncbi:MAG TPA: tetratricopeptide repeat protein [Blastocatellia bacterium]